MVHTHDAASPSHTQKVSALEKDITQAHLENHQLRLEVHRWRKQHALVKLRLAGAQEDLDLQATHNRQLEARCDTLESTRAALMGQMEGLKAQLQEANAQLHDLAARQAGAKEEASKLKVRLMCGKGAGSNHGLH